MFETTTIINGVVFVDAKPTWVHSGLPSNEIAKLVSPLLKFFVIESPVEGLSARQVPLMTYGWSAPWKKPEWLNRKLKDAASNKNFYWSCEKYGGMEEVLGRSPLGQKPIDTSSPIEVAVIYDCKKNQTLSLFYHIRNSLAHGRFCAFRHKRDIWFAFEDVQKAKKKKDDPADCARLTARILIKNRTLAKWIKLIKQGPSPKNS